MMMANRELTVIFLTILLNMVFSQLTIYNFPVGQGDGTILHCPNGDITLIDAGSLSIDGRTTKIGTNYKDFLIAIKEMTKGSIKNIFLTHGDQDHYNFVPHVMRDVMKEDEKESVKFYIGGDVDNYVTPGNTMFLKNRERVYGFTARGSSDKKPHACGVKIKGVFKPCVPYDIKSGVMLTEDKATVPICDDDDDDEAFAVTVFAGNYGYLIEGNMRTPKNKDSLVLKITPHPEYRAPKKRKTETLPPSMLILGDFENAGVTDGNFYRQLVKTHEYYVSELGKDDAALLPSRILWKTGLKSDILLVPHHGASTNGQSDENFLSKVSPTYAVVSADIHGNRHGHPTCLSLNKVSKHMTGKGEKDIQCVLNKKRVSIEMNKYLYTTTEYSLVYGKTLFFLTKFTMSSTGITGAAQELKFSIP